MKERLQLIVNKIEATTKEIEIAKSSIRFYEKDSKAFEKLLTFDEQIKMGVPVSKELLAKYISDNQQYINASKATMIELIEKKKVDVKILNADKRELEKIIKNYEALEAKFPTISEAPIPTLEMVKPLAEKILVEEISKGIDIDNIKAEVNYIDTDKVSKTAEVKKHNKK